MVENRLRLRNVTLWVYIALFMCVIALMIRVKWFYGFMVLWLVSPQVITRI